MIWKIAWRNIWRNKKRSGILLAAIAFGLWAGLLTSGMFNGMSEQMVRSAIDTRTSHVQLHAKGFLDHPDVSAVIPNGADALRRVRSTAGVARAAGRAIVPGMASSPTTGAGVMLYGVVPKDEVALTSLSQKIIDGSYLGEDRHNTCVIGKELADKLGLRVGSKVVVQGQTQDGSIAGGAFRIVGLFKTVSLGFDKTVVFAPAGDVDRVFGLGGAIHEIAARATSQAQVRPLQEALASEFPGLEVERWDQLEPEIGLLTSSSNQMSRILMVLIMIALAFGITNTMLMSVLERTRELGMLESLGMRQNLVFGMVMIETVALALIGGVTGAALGGATVATLGHTGINLSIVATGLASAGIESVLYPSLTGAEYPIVGVLVFATAVIGAIYPSIKASTLSPVKAMRTY